MARRIVLTDPLLPRAWACCAASAGPRPIRLHDLRHGAASLVLAGGADIAVVSERLGHSSIRVTANTYHHLLEGPGGRQLTRPRAWCARE